MGGIEQVIFQLCEGSSDRVTNKVLTLSPTPNPASVRVANHEVVRAKQDFCLASSGFSRSPSTFPAVIPTIGTFE